MVREGEDEGMVVRGWDEMEGVWEERDEGQGKMVVEVKVKTNRGGMEINSRLQSW